MTGRRDVSMGSETFTLTEVRIDRSAAGGIRIDGKDDKGREVILLPGSAPVSIVEVSRRCRIG